MGQHISLTRMTFSEYTQVKERLLHDPNYQVQLQKNPTIYYVVWENTPDDAHWELTGHEKFGLQIGLQFTHSRTHEKAETILRAKPGIYVLSLP
jgi:hypothetical protein